MKNHIVSILATGLLAGPISANAVPITFGFHGSITSVGSNVSSAFAVDQRVSGFYTFESDTVGQSFAPGGVIDPTITYYPSALSAFEVTLGAYRVRLGSGEQRIFVMDNDAGVRDRYIVEMFAPNSAQVNGLPAYGLFLQFQDNSATAFDNGALPLSPIDLSRFSFSDGVLDFVSGGTDLQNRVQFRVNSITSVPEPSSLSLLGLGVLAIWVRARRKTSRSPAGLIGRETNRGAEE
jgi:hypothetical protein